MRSTSSTQSGSRRRKILLCGVAVVGATMIGATAGAASPTPPGAPKIESVKASGLNRVSITVKKPTDTGGAAISGFRATCTSTNGGSTSSHNSVHSPVLVPNLTSGKTYTCTVVAINSAGAGPASDPSAEFVARPTVPGPPKLDSATPGLRSITVAFTAPANNGFATITDYRVVCTSSNGGTTRGQQAKKSPIRVVGLTAAATYTCTVAGHNRVGVGTPSSPSSAVIVLPRLPGAPTITSARATGSNSVTVTFDKPANTGGAPITHYLVECTSSNGGKSRSRLAAHSPIRVNGLSAGKTYTCTVAATNTVRYGPKSKPSNPVVPRAH